MKTLNRWIYAIAGVLVLLLAGLIYAWSVISKVIVSAFPEWSAAQLSFTFTITMTMFCLGCLIAGMLSHKVPAKIYVLLSGFFFLAGFIIASMAYGTPIMLYIGFGILCGLGAGFAYNVVMSTISAWFPDQQGLISGILLMGFGLSSFIIGKIFIAVTPADGSDAWRITFRIFAVIIFAVMCICSFFFVKPETDFIFPKTSSKKEVRPPASEASPDVMIRIPSFWLYYVWVMVVSAAGLALISQASGLASVIGKNVSDSTIATVVGLISIMNGAGRVFFGFLFDKVGFKRTMILDMLIFSASGILLFAALYSHHFALVILGFMAGGFAYGGVASNNSALINDFFGKKSYAINFSILNTNLIFASFASTIAGKLYDISHSYVSTIFMMLLMTIIGFIVFMGIRRPSSEPITRTCCSKDFC